MFIPIDIFENSFILFTKWEKKAKYVPWGKNLTELALLKPNKSFGTYKREEYVRNETKRPTPVSSSSRIKRHRKEEDIRTDYSRVEDIEELNLPAPIPDLPPFQHENYEEDNYEYDEGADDGEIIEDAPLTVSDVTIRTMMIQTLILW